MVKFLILGNINAVCYKDIFPYIKENKVWLGVNRHDLKYNVPDTYPLKGSCCGIDENGRKWIKVAGVRWFTNLKNKPNPPLQLTQHYSPEKYPRYDNYDAIEVGRTTDIPCDYDGIMGVPITFLNKYNPSQFEIIKFRKGNDEKDLSVSGKCPYFRILIRRK